MNECALSLGGFLCHGVPCPLGHYWHVAPNQFLKEDLRHHLGYYLLLSLEFLIAADIVHTLLTPTLADLAILGAIVAIRTQISFSINWELRQARRHEAGVGQEHLNGLNRKSLLR